MGDFVFLQKIIMFWQKKACKLCFHAKAAIYGKGLYLKQTGYSTRDILYQGFGYVHTSSN